MLRIAVELIIFLLLVAATAFLLRPLQVEFIREAAAFRDSVIAYAETALQRRIRYQSMSPSIFRNIDLRGVTVAAEDGTLLFSTDRLRVKYSLIGILKGSGIAALEGIQFDRPLVRLDLLKDQDILALLEKALKPGAFAQPPARITIRNGDIRISRGVDHATLHDFSADFRPNGAFYEVKAHARTETAGWFLPSEFGTGKATIDLQGEIAAAFDSARLTLRVPRMETDVFVIARQAASVELINGTWTMRKVLDRRPFDYRVDYDAVRNLVQVQASMEKLNLLDTVQPIGAWASFDTWLSVSLTGSAEATVSSGRLEFGIEAAGEGLSRSPLKGAAISLTATADAERANIEYASMRSARGNLEFVGTLEFAPFRPEGSVTIENLRLPDGSALGASIQITREGEGSAIFADSLTIGNLRLDAVDAFLRIDAETLAFTATAFRFEDSDDYTELRLGKVNLEGSWSFAGPFIQTVVSFDSFSAADIYSAARPFIVDVPLSPTQQRLLGNVTLTAELFLTTDLADFSFNVPRLVAAYRGPRDPYAVLSLAGTSERFDLKEIKLFWDGGTAAAEASADFSDPQDIAFSVSANYADIPYSFEGLLIEGNNLSLSGDYGVLGNFLLDPDAGVSGSISCTSLPVQVGELRYSIGADAVLRYATPDQWWVEVRRADLEASGPPLIQPVRSSCSARADQDQAYIKDISFIDSIGELSGFAQLDWRNGFAATSMQLRLQDADGIERYELDASLEQGGVRFRSYAAKAKAARALPAYPDTSATGEIRGYWTNAAAFDISFFVAELKGSYQSDEFIFSGSGRIDQNTASLEAAELEYKGSRTTLARLEIDRENASASLAASFIGVFAGRTAETDLRAQFEFTPVDAWKDALIAFDRAAVTIIVEKSRYGALSFEPFDLRLQRDSRSFSLEGGPRDALRVRLGEDGAFYLALASPSPVRATVIGSLNDAMIDAHASDLLLDFPAIWSLLDVREIVFTGGSAAGDLSISGPISDPDIFGTVSASGFSVLIPDWISEEVGAATTDIRFDGKEFSFGPSTVTAATGRGTISGLFRLDRWLPSEFRLDINVPVETPLPAQTAISGINAAGLAAGRLTLATTAENFAISGSLEVANTTITIDAESLAAASTQVPQPVPITVDVRLRTGRKVEFVWPSSDFPVLRGYADTGDTLEIAVDGMTGRFNMLGDIAFRGGEVFYFMRSFYIREGMIRFNENELRFDPRLSIRAEIRDRNEDGPVTVSMVVDEAPISTFVPRFESSPPLSQVEIFGLLGQNILATGDVVGPTEVQGALLTASSDVLAQFNVVRVFERNTRELLGLDMFSVRTQLIQNAFFGATGLIPDQNASDGGLGNYFDNTTVYIGKFLGSDIFLQAILSVQIDESKSTDALGGLGLEPDIGIEWKTPFFMLRWNFLPMHPENLFIDDHSFTFTWRKTF